MVSPVRGSYGSSPVPESYHRLSGQPRRSRRRKAVPVHRRLLKSLVPLVGAAALIAAPIAFAAPASAAGISAAVIAPDESIPFDEDLNHVEYWEEYLAEEEGIDAWCAKNEDIGDPFTIPSIDEIWDAEEGENWDDYDYVLAVLKGGAAEGAHELYWEPSEGDELSHADAGNSHVILCIAELEDEPTPPVTTPPVTGPVVETDRVADTGSAAGLGLAAAATALVAGIGAMMFGRRRQGSHR